MLYPWTWLVGFYCGATIGSFLNVVIYRMPRGLSLYHPKNSFCPSCKHQLGPLDLFPLFSWLFLRGQCRYCKSKVSSRYFFVEFLNGAIWGGLWYQYLCLGYDPAKGVAYALAASTLVSIIFIDWELYIIPDQINAFLFLVGIGYNVYLYSIHSPAAVLWGMPSSIAGGLVGVFALWFIAFAGRIAFGRDAMGHGDIKMARGIGAVLLPGVAAMGFALAIVMGAVLGIAQVLIFKSKESTFPAHVDGIPAPDAKVAAETHREIGDLQPEEEDVPPETIASLIKCGFGYVLCLDIIGLFLPKFYISWFGEDPFTPIQEMEEFEVERTMIPFGPYLALGAILAAVFQAQLLHGWDAYVDWVKGGPSPSFLEQPYRDSGQNSGGRVK